MRAAFAHEAAFHGAGTTLGSAWTLDPLVLAPLGAAAYLYWKGSLRFGVREACFALGMAALFFALVWPLDVLGERLFSAHMAQHLVMMNIAAPLLVLGAPLAAMLRALPPALRVAAARLGAGRRWRGAWHWLSGIVVASVLQQVALWGWHAPRAVAASLASEAVHVAMHASLLAAALLFWTAVLRPRASAWLSIAGLLATLKVTGLVSIVLLLAPGARYGAYGDMAAAWGLSPLEDEQLGWGVMMVVGSASYLAALVALFAVLLNRLGAGKSRSRAPR